MTPADPAPDSPDALRVAALTTVLGYERIGYPDHPHRVWWWDHPDPGKRTYEASVGREVVARGADCPASPLPLADCPDPAASLADAMLLVEALCRRGVQCDLTLMHKIEFAWNPWRARLYRYYQPGRAEWEEYAPTPALAVTRAAVACARTLNEREERT